ncbi:putative protein S-acyltransferase 17 [Blattamonas nauphoetae]|uniref:Palmitoyltransferase n=1 Tax=Blattamonas nauphoetae TaxID=2049346 RepID=A0ABQ9XG34_9EUKA|nr:putative protein S-acyltransferase 17 [Blattamonas nauphoetae]
MFLNKIIDFIYYLTNERNPAVMIFYCFIVLALIALWSFTTVPHIPNSHCSILEGISCFLLILASIWSFVWTVRSNPGYITRDTVTAVFDVFPYDNFIYSKASFCEVCQLPRPPRSHHCDLCKRCVSKHDHHCAWVNNCIGEHNLFHFLSFLALHTLALFSIFHTSLTALCLTICSSHGIRCPPNPPLLLLCFTPSMRTLAFVSAQRPWLFSLTLFSFLMAVLLAFFTLLQLRQALSGLTTREKWKFSKLQALSRMAKSLLSSPADLSPSERESLTADLAHPSKSIYGLPFLQTVKALVSPLSTRPRTPTDQACYTNLKSQEDWTPILQKYAADCPGFINRTRFSVVIQRERQTIQERMQEMNRKKLDRQKKRSQKEK